MSKTYRVKSDPLTVRDVVFIAGWGVLYGAVGVVLVAPSAALLWAAYRLETRWQNANRELTQPRRTGVGGALDNAAARGQR